MEVQLTSRTRRIYALCLRIWEPSAVYHIMHLEPKLRMELMNGQTVYVAKPWWQ